MIKLSYFQHQLLQTSFVGYWLLFWRVLKFVKASRAEKYIFIFCINIYWKTRMTETTIENIVKRVHAYVNLVQRQVVYSVAVFYS